MTDVAESITNAWTVFEHIKTIKRWKDNDQAWIKMSQEGLLDSLAMLIGRDKATKRVANARIALRKHQDERKQEETKLLKEEVDAVDAVDTLAYKQAESMGLYED